MKIEVIELQEGVSNATLTAYIQDSDIDNGRKVKKPAIIICPGGAYLGYTEKEAEPVALRFLSEGYNAFVLRYSIGAGRARFPAPFIDTAHAVMLVRQNACRWSIDPDNIALCGFSAGGHAAVTLAVTWQEEYLAKALNADNNLFKPNALVLGYPILDMYRFAVKNLERNKSMQPLLEMMLSAVFGTIQLDEKLMDQWNYINRITSHMPPVFLWMTAEDALVDAADGLDLVRALAANNITYEFHIFEKGAHGLALGNQAEVYLGSGMGHNGGNAFMWTNLALNWLANRVKK